MTKPNPDQAAARLYDLIRLIRPAHRRLARSVSVHLDGTGLSLGGRAVLELLAETGPLSVAAAARQLFLARQQVQLVMDALDQQGHVQKRPNPAHRRSPLFALTDQGRAAFASLHARELNRLGDFAAQLEDADLSAALRVMTALVDGFGAYEDDPDAPQPLA